MQAVYYDFVNTTFAAELFISSPLPYEIPSKNVQNLHLVLNNSNL